MKGIFKTKGHSGLCVLNGKRNGHYVSRLSTSLKVGVNGHALKWDTQEYLCPYELLEYEE